MKEAPDPTTPAPWTFAHSRNTARDAHVMGVVVPACSAARHYSTGCICPLVAQHPALVSEIATDVATEHASYAWTACQGQGTLGREASVGGGSLSLTMNGQGACISREASDAGLEGMEADGAGAPTTARPRGPTGAPAYRAPCATSSAGSTVCRSVSGNWHVYPSCAGCVKPVASIHENTTTTEGESV